MKNLTVVLLGIAVAALAVFCYSQAVRLRKERRRVKKLTEDLSAAHDIVSLDVQEKCMKLAERFPGPYHNHYNATLGKCLVLQYDFGATAPPGYKAVFKTLSNATEEEQSYAKFYWTGKKGENMSDDPEPQACSVTLPSGQIVLCHSLDEFDALVKQHYGIE